MHPKSPLRRTHSPQLKAEVMAACRQPGASVAAIALAHGLNTNVVRKWLAGHGLKRCAQMTSADGIHANACAQFVPVSLPLDTTGKLAATDVHLDLNLGALQIKLHCARSAACSVAMLLHALADMVAQT